MAADELNVQGGILSRPIELVIGDGGESTDAVVAETTRMIVEESVQAVVGSHVSTTRLALVDAIGGRIPYVYTTLYEGGQYSHGVFVTGETPDQQLRPLIQWLRQYKQARRWYLIGNDYVFPRASISEAKQYLAAVDGVVVGEEYQPFFVDNFGGSLDRIAGSGADAVLVYLVGQDSVLFNREFAARGLSGSILRAAPVLCENALLGIGARNTDNLYSSTPFSNSMETPAIAAFRSAYGRSFGEYAPVLNRFGLACYEGVHLLAVLAERAGSLNVHKMQAGAEGASFKSPRGTRRMSSNHLSTTTHIVESRGVDMRLIDTVGSVAPPRARSPIWPSLDAGSA